jgi:CRP/FNR family cyclic AMP-dependent transcriptional regulator
MWTSVIDSNHNGSAMGAVFANPSFGASRIELREPTVLFEPSSSADNVYFIESGQIRIYQISPDGSTRLAEILGPGDWFGVASLCGAETYGSRAVIVSKTVLWSSPAERLLKLLGQQPDVAVEMVCQLAIRLEAANDTAARLVFNDCNERLIQTLVKFSRTSAATLQEDGGVVLRITHQQLAQAVGAARETVSLALTQLRQQNLLRTGRNRLLFNPDTLEQFSKRGIPATVGAALAN